MCSGLLILARNSNTCLRTIDKMNKGSKRKLFVPLTISKSSSPPQAPTQLSSRPTSPKQHIPVDRHIVLEALKGWFGYDTFRGHQQDVVESILSGSDVLVVSGEGGREMVKWKI